MNKEKSVKILKFYITGLNELSFQHKVQGKIFAAQGLNKLGAKYAEHSVEEAEWVEKMMNRVLDLGGELSIDPTEGLPVYENIVDYLKADAKVSDEGIEKLRSDMLSVSDDVITYDLLKDYLKDEEEDASWTDAQLNLIAMIGLENWLVQQL